MRSAQEADSGAFVTAAAPSLAGRESTPGSDRGRAQRARRGARRRTNRTRALAAVVVVVVLAGAAAGIRQRSGNGPVTPAARPAPAADVAPQLPAGWRTETFHGVQLGVPEDWDHGTTGAQWCVRRGPGHAGRSYVGRPGGLTAIGCGGADRAHPEQDPAYHLEPGGTFVWFAGEDSGWWGMEGQKAGPLTAPALVGDRATVVVDGVMIAVQAPAAQRERILATVHRATTDAHGCPVQSRFGPEPGWRPPAGDAVGRLTGVTVVSACSYVVTGGLGSLSSSVQLRNHAAAAAVAGVAAAPPGSGPPPFRSCRKLGSYDSEVFLLLIRSRQGANRVVMRWESCRQRGFDDGHTVRALTRRAVAPFLVAPNAVPAISGDLAGVFPVDGRR